MFGCFLSAFAGDAEIKISLDWTRAHGPGRWFDNI
jgi:hypothetical protein